MADGVNRPPSPAVNPFMKQSHDRDVMMNTVAPVWDGNETWLVLGGAGLFGAFPLAYSVVLSALYLPLILMLMGLIFRGVAFEFRFKSSEASQHWWDKAFIGGSLTATFFQGVALGAFIEGLPVVDRQYAGGSLDWPRAFWAGWLAIRAEFDRRRFWDSTCPVMCSSRPRPPSRC